VNRGFSGFDDGPSAVPFFTELQKLLTSNVSLRHKPEIGVSRGFAGGSKMAHVDPVQPSAFPAAYDDLIEGQPPSSGAPYTGLVPGLHLIRGWQNEFGSAQKYFRVGGFQEGLDRNNLSLNDIRQPPWDRYHHNTRMLALVPASWKDQFFRTAFETRLRKEQIADAARGLLQRFDRAALSILFLRGALDEKGLAWAPLLRYVRLRPVTFYVEGFDKAYGVVRSDAAAMGELEKETGQPVDVFEKMADGHWFVTRKTAELTLRALVELNSKGGLRGAIPRLSVRCGLTRIRSSTKLTIRPVPEEVLLYSPDEYLSPAAWGAIPAPDQVRIKAPPL
jgi:hypothetical protein